MSKKRQSEKSQARALEKKRRKVKSRTAINNLPIRAGSRYDEIAAKYPDAAIPDTHTPAEFERAVSFLEAHGGKLQKSKQLLLLAELYDLPNETDFWASQYRTACNALVGGLDELWTKAGRLALDQEEEIRATVEILPMYGTKPQPKVEGMVVDPMWDRQNAKLGPVTLSYVSVIHVDGRDVDYAARAAHALMLCATELAKHRYDAVVPQPRESPAGDPHPQALQTGWAARISLTFYLPLALNQEISTSP